MASSSGLQELQRELAETRERLRQSENQLRALVSASPIPLFITRRADGTILLASHEFGRLLGAERDKLLGCKAHEFYANPGDRDELLDRLARTGQARGYELRVRRTDGTILWVSAAIVVDKIDDDEVLIGGFHDIDDRRRAERSLQDALDQLEQANLDLRRNQTQLVQSEKMAALGSLMAGVAHEINTPVGAISSMHDTLSRAVAKLRATVDEQAPELAGERRLVNTFSALEDAAKVIQSASSRVATIVKRLRSFARVDDAEPSECNLHEGIEDTLTLLQHQTKDRIEVVKNFGDLPKVECFAGQVNQVFLNILVNAVQAIEGPGTITITTSQTADKMISIAIADTGGGIAAENLEHIFDPGFTTKGPTVGTGLGLSICRKIVDRHRGKLSVQSELGKGSTFTVTLPVRIN